MEQAAAAPTPFFPVSLSKLLVMSLCTIGVYQFYWFYKNWQHVRSATGATISPFWRTFFFFFYAHSFFKRVGDADPRGARLPAVFLALIWITLAIFVTPVMVLASLPVQGVINSANAAAAPGHDPNANFSAWNWAAIFIGAPILILSIYVLAAGDVVIAP